MKTVIWPDRTVKQLFKCFEMIAEISQAAANEQIRIVKEKASRLERFPEMGKPLNDFTRTLVVNKKIIIHYMLTKDYVVITQVKPTAMK